MSCSVLSITCPTLPDTPSFLSVLKSELGFGSRSCLLTVRIVMQAANLLVHDDGRILLADFGVAAALKYDDVISVEPAPEQQQQEGPHKRRLFRRQHRDSKDLPPSHPARQLQKRMTFAGTPCFMAPEVLEQLDG